MDTVYYIHAIFPLCHYKGFAHSKQEIQSIVENIHKSSISSIFKSEISDYSRDSLKKSIDNNIFDFLSIITINTKLLPEYRKVFCTMNVKERLIRNENLRISDMEPNEYIL